MRKAPIFKMHEIVRANWNVPGLVRNDEYQVKDISRDAAGVIRGYRLASPSLREDVWVEAPHWNALSASPHGQHEDIDSRKAKFESISLKDLRIGDVVIASDPHGRTSYGMGGKGAFEVLKKGPKNLTVLSVTQPAPGGPVYRHELKLPLHHVHEVKRVHYL